MAIRRPPQRRPLNKLMVLGAAAASSLALAGCMGPTGVDANGKPVYVNNCLIKTMCLDIPANRPCPDQQCVEMRQEVMLQLMRNQQATYEAQMRTMHQPVPMTHTYHCTVMPMGYLAQMNCQ